MKKCLAIVMIVAVIVGLAATLLIDVVPANEATRSAIMETSVRIQLYAQSQGKLPGSLDVLPLRAHHVNTVNDGWERTLIYSIDGDGVLSLKSLGKDGHTGGFGDDADFEVRYRTRGDDDRFLCADPMWLASAKIEVTEPGLARPAREHP